MSELTKALIAFQAELPDVSKGGTNPAFKSKYATLPDITKAVFPLTAKHGLAFVAYPDETDHGPVLRFELRHESGESIAGAFGLPDGAKAQEYGSWMTYFRRYILSALTGITPDDDDDGNSATSTRARRPVVVPTRHWVEEANVLPTADAALTLYNEAKAAGASTSVLSNIAERGKALRAAENPGPDEWAPVAPVAP